jgi:hypothetical protein
MYACNTVDRRIERDNADLFDRVRLPLVKIGRHDPQMLPLLEYWNARRADGLLPKRADISPLDLKKYLGRLHIVDTRASNPDGYRFKLWGSGCYIDGGTDYTNLHVGEYPSSPWRKALAQDYRDVVSFGVAAYHVVSAVHDFSRYEYARLILPLSEDGRVVTGLLVHSHKRPARELVMP